MGETQNASAEMPPAGDDKLGLEQLKLLFDYTKFHITAYMTLAGVVVTALNGNFTARHQCPLWLALVFIVVAGAAGGVVASNIPYHSDALTFADTQIGPWTWAPMKAKWWMTLEHLAFWAALVSTALAFVV